MKTRIDLNQDGSPKLVGGLSRVNTALRGMSTSQQIDADKVTYRSHEMGYGPLDVSVSRLQDGEGVWHIRMIIPADDKGEELVAEVPYEALLSMEDGTQFCAQMNIARAFEGILHTFRARNGVLEAIARSKAENDALEEQAA